MSPPSQKKVAAATKIPLAACTIFYMLLPKHKKSSNSNKKNHLWTLLEPPYKLTVLEHGSRAHAAEGNEDEDDLLDLNQAPPGDEDDQVAVHIHDLNFLQPEEQEHVQTSKNMVNH
jgi:hypothetical protein